MLLKDKEVNTRRKTQRIENGCFWNGIPLPEGTITIADYFNENGYDTAYIGKWHLASDRDDTERAVP